MKDFIRIHPKDNVVLVLKDLKKDRIIVVDEEPIHLKEDIKAGHKIAVRDIRKDENIIKYGYPIGHAFTDIWKGQWVHTHNVKTNLSKIEKYSYCKNSADLNIAKRNITFKGFRREDGKVGIRNELWIVPTVGCVNGVAEKIIEEFKKEINPEGIDGIQVFKHSFGCSQLGQDHENTRKILGDIVKHPNGGGILVLGLGCENNYVSAFKDSLGPYNEKRVRFLVAQEVPNEISAGIHYLKELYEIMKKDVREDIPISELVVGLKCGGSDGFSGITANPLLGAFSDFLIAQGGSTVLTEVPEMFGAETILMNRCVNAEVYNKMVRLINDFKEYFITHNQPVYENPSPGNKEGGITTLEEKSLGCTQKGGNAEVVDVLQYGDVIKQKGLNLLSAPGNDLVATTALGAAGCHMVLFTTGRGTPFGSFVPTVKIATNSPLFQRKPHWIDFNGGSLIEETSMEDMLESFIDFVIEVASGSYVNNEKNDFREIALFKSGVTV